ncbi:hypothetical protein UBN20_12200 [Helicobacter pylori]
MTTTMMKQIKTMKLQDLADAVYNVMPTKLGDRNYWENFTKKTGNIARTLNNRLKDIFEKNPQRKEV